MFISLTGHAAERDAGNGAPDGTAATTGAEPEGDTARKEQVK